MPGLHTLEFEGGRVTLLLALGDVAAWLPELQAPVDAVYLDGFAPSRNAAMWDPHTLRALSRLAAPGATAATWSAARSARDGLACAGFHVLRVPGFAGKREMTVAQRHPPATGRLRGAPPGRCARPDAHEAIVVGAGLAGAAAAWALSRQGLQVTVLESAAQPATAGSGNPGGLFHGVVHAHDGAHAQWLRAAALRAEQVYRPLIESGRIPGRIEGLLRGAEPLAALQAVAAAQALPPAYAQALSRDQSAERAKCPLAGAAWCFPGGGWLQPAALARTWLQSAGVVLRTATRVASLEPLPGGRWRALDGDGVPLAEADIAIVAAAHGTPGLLAPHGDALGWPWRRTRGQITVVRAAEARALPRPAVPVASGGYLLALPEALGGGLLCGATSQADDEVGAIRPEDHRANLAQVAALTGVAVEPPPAWFEGGEVLGGRVGWRLGCDDRLPVLGGVPVPRAALQGLPRLEQARHVPRVPGLYVLAGLGSRGITWAPLLGEVLAALVVGAPVPVAGSLLDVVDPARFVSREVRRSGR